MENLPSVVINIRKVEIADLLISCQYLQIGKNIDM